MAGVEQCIAAIGSAFYGGAELMQAMQDRRTNTGRHNQHEHDPERAYGERMLCKAFGNSAEKCLRGSEERKYRFGKSFSVGDGVAISELTLIMVNLQMQVISTLQQTAGSGEATLDVARLHEAVITAKSNTLRSMDELCQRIVYGTRKPDMGRHSGPLLDSAHQNMSSFSLHDSVADHQSQNQHNAARSLGAPQQRRHTMTGIAESEREAPPFTWPSRSTASSCRSISSESSLSCRSSASSHFDNPPTTSDTTAERPSIPEAMPVVHNSEPILRRKSMRSAFLRRPSKPTLNVSSVHPAYREKPEMASTTALLAEKPVHLWSPVSTAVAKVLGRAATRCKKLGA